MSAGISSKYLFSLPSNPPKLHPNIISSGKEFQRSTACHMKNYILFFILNLIPVNVITNSMGSVSEKYSQLPLAFLSMPLRIVLTSLLYPINHLFFSLKCPSLPQLCPHYTGSFKNVFVKQNYQCRDSSILRGLFLPTGIKLVLQIVYPLVAGLH